MKELINKLSSKVHDAILSIDELLEVVKLHHDVLVNFRLRIKRLEEHVLKEKTDEGEKILD